MQNTNARIVPVVQDYYISFITTPNPNTRKDSTAPSWESFGSGNGERLKLQTNHTATEKIDPTTESLRKTKWGWNQIMPQ